MSEVSKELLSIAHELESQALEGIQHQGFMKRASMCSRDKPLVSGSSAKKKIVPSNERTEYNQKAPRRK